MRRAGRAFALAQPEDFDFDAIFEGADWFHFAGITPAVSPQTASLTRAAVECARRHGVTVSCDLNYRGKLWTPQQAQAFMKSIMGHIGCTLRESYSASDNGWSVLCYDGQEFAQSRHYDIRLVDRGGGGASFAAGFIYGILRGLPLSQIAEFAGAA